MLPNVVFTHRNGVQPAARLPAPVTIGKCWQPAFSTAGQQDRPSLTTFVPGAKSRLASFSTSRLRKPSTTLSRSPGRVAAFPLGLPDGEAHPPQHASARLAAVEVD